MGLPLISGRECIAALAKIGYMVVRQKGSHVRLACAGRSPVTVPMHDERDRGTLRAILRAARVPHDEFVMLLG